MENPDDFSSYVSAPNSPAQCSPGNNLFFCSAPGSPRKRTISNTPYDACYSDHEYMTPPMTPYQDANSDLDDFEFETSRSFNLDVFDNVKSQQKASLDRKQQEQIRQQRQCKESLPMTMSFADELFCDGKVMPLAPPALKLPPRLHQKRSGSQSPMPSSPRSPSFVSNLPFSYRRLWNDDFDPFMVALEHVREEKRRGKEKTDDHNMVGLNDQQNKQTGLLTPIHSPSANSAGQLEPRKQVGQSQKRLALPKGLEFARQVRLIQNGYNERFSELNMARPVCRVEETPKNKIFQGSGDQRNISAPCTKETKGQKIKGLSLSASFGKVDDDKKKQRDQSSAILSRKPTFLRRLISKSGGSAHCSGEKRVSDQLAKTTFVHFRPRLLLCMGYKARYAK
ncbi:hypothetical protein PRUPE_4G260600 [Prunus persica]|uniref:Uncharacterized protein n=1 Tax=Prunus persica TaxID=3760 RepID=M5WLJ1_PRUPE|nr:hypothetical protein PRUPE_4G260600 [Prunus persica]